MTATALPETVAQKIALITTIPSLWDAGVCSSLTIAATCLSPASRKCHPSQDQGDTRERIHGDALIQDQDAEKSRRTLELPQRCADALRLHRDRQDQLRKRAGDRWHHDDLVFASRVGTALWAGNVRRSFRTVLAAAGLNPAEWTPRELRHSFVSLMSDAGVPIEKIARLVGHTGTATTEAVYRKQIRPVVVGGAEVMDTLFPRRDADA
jgi:integrase